MLTAGFRPLRSAPPVSDARLLGSLSKGGMLGCDAEWDMRTNQTTLWGLSDGRLTVSDRAHLIRPYLKDLIARAPKLVGHNFIGAERPIFKRLGIDVPLEKVEDTIILHWLCNAHLCKARSKSDESNDPKGRGFMNLWTMLSQYTDAWNYKQCRGKEFCVDIPCPDHQPEWYNGLDAYWPLKALPGLYKHLSLRVDSYLYPFHKRLMEALVEMREYGIHVDVPYIGRLDAEFRAAKNAVWTDGSGSCALAGKFNPESPKQVKAYFKRQGVDIENAQEETVRELYNETGDPDLRLLLDWKELGDGTNRWFAPKVWDESKGKWTGYVEPDGTIHPWLAIYTSSGRLQCSGPNMQNVEKRRIDRTTGEKVGKKIRRAIIAPDGHYLLRGDLKNGENIACLYQAGYQPDPLRDFHQENVGKLGLDESDEFSIRMGGAREAAKSISHAADYAEGLVLIDSPYSFARGPRLVFPDWRFEGRTVAFTGINFARRAFGDAGFANRQRALEFLAAYYAAWPKLRDWQMRVCKQIEKDLAVRTPLGYYTLLYGDGAERIKTALAIYGSQPIAHVTKQAILHAREDGRLRVVLQIHDELLSVVSCSVPPRTAGKWMNDYLTGFSLPNMPGLKLRADISYGNNWADTNPIA